MTDAVPMNTLRGKRIVITGGSGLVGKALTEALRRQGAEIAILSRTRATIYRPWDQLEELLEGAYGIVNLAGESIAAEKWTWERKKALRDSRILSTRKLTKALEKVSQRPQVLVSASAIGFYGPRGSEILDEESPAGDGFLSELCQKWEDTADEAKMHEARVVKLRIGTVLSKNGGALPELRKIAKQGMASKLGDGKQGMSWIHIEDLTGLIVEALINPAFEGVINATAPGALSNKAFMKALAAKLHRPFWPVPGFITRFFIERQLGELGRALLLEGAYIRPSKALSLGFQFHYPVIGKALEHLLRQ